MSFKTWMKEAKNSKRKRWITSDWHLGEDRMEIMMRPFSSESENVEKIIKNHNSLVKESDLVIVVGDAVNQNKPDHVETIKRLNGHKILIRGNHDRPYSDKELGEYFEEIIDEGDGLELEVEVDGEPLLCWATHYPTQARKDRFNLVGHIHSAWKVQLNSVNVGVDCNHFRPHDLDEFVPFAYNAISKFYDQDVWAAYHNSNKSYVGKRGKEGVYFTKA